MLEKNNGSSGLQPRGTMIYIKFPKSILKDRSLSESTKVVYMALLDRNKFFQGRQFFCRQDWLANSLSMSDRDVNRHIRTLNGGGLITIERRGNYNHYTVREPDMEEGYTPVPHRLISDACLTAVEKVTLTVLMDLERHYSFHTTGEFNPCAFTHRIDSLAQALGIKNRQVTNILNSLKQKGYIAIEKAGRLNSYTINWDKFNTINNTMEEKVEDKKINDNQESTLPEAVRQFIKNSSIQRVDPDDDDFPAFVLQEIGKERMGLWLYLSKKRMGKHLLNEINKYVTELSARHYSGEYQQSIREICLRRVRNAS